MSEARSEERGGSSGAHSDHEGLTSVRLGHEGQSGWSCLDKPGRRVERLRTRGGSSPRVCSRPDKSFNVMFYLSVDARARVRLRRSLLTAQRGGVRV